MDLLLDGGRDRQTDRQTVWWIRPPLIADEGVVELVVDHQQLCDQLLVQQARDELHYSGLHALTHRVQLLLRARGGDDTLGSTS